MDTLFTKHDQYLQVTPMEIVRDCMNDIDWDAPMLSIRGPKGVGKSTLMRQYIKMHFAPDDRSVLYCSLDGIYFASHRLLDLAEMFYHRGGKHLFLDEVHKYENWSRELKEVSDLYPDLHIVISGSSLLSLSGGQGDLSRRCIDHDISGLSFREYLCFYKGIKIPRYTLEEILTNPVAICRQVNELCQPLAEFHTYLQYGYYPFYLHFPKSYGTAIEQVLNLVIDEELPAICKVETANCRKIKALIDVLCSTVPFEVDISRMSQQSGLQRNTVIEYLSHLQKAGILNLLYSDLRNVKKMQKPDKIYLENSNMLYALMVNNVPIGTIRETFAVNQLSYLHMVEYGKKQGDFRVDGLYTFEVGGADKTYKQIADIPNSYILADDITTPIRNKLPLWMFGFLY